MAFIGCIGLKNHDEDDYSIFRWFVPYMFGFLLALAGTLFFHGLIAQAKEIMSKERRFSSITWIAATVLNLIIGFAAQNSTICVILCLIQFLGVFWYASTMIPGFKKFFCCCCRMASSGGGALAGAV